MICKSPFIRANVNRREAASNPVVALDATPFPCGNCLPCKIARARVWQTRIMLERITHEESVFITLTYDDEHIPRNWSLYYPDFQDFFKRFRYYHKDRNIRYFVCGEYGEQQNRPHYHAALFGVNGQEKIQKGNSIKTIPILDKSWGQGFVYIGELNDTTARYITRYVVKGLTKNPTKKGKDKLNGREPEFMRASKGSKYQNGGLGYEAIMQMGERNKGKTKEVIRAIRIGKTMYPLGRYLTKKLNEALGHDERRIEEEFKKYQETLFDDHMVIGKNYYLDFKDSMQGKVIRKEKLDKIFKQRRVL